MKVDLQSVIDALKELGEDTSVPKNIKARIQEIIAILNQKEESSIKVNKSLHLLEEIAEDTNIKSYTRTQLWNVVSLLEKV